MLGLALILIAGLGLNSATSSTDENFAPGRDYRIYEPLQREVSTYSTYDGPFQYNKLSGIPGGEPIEGPLVDYLSRDQDPEDYSKGGVDVDRAWAAGINFFFSNRDAIISKWAAVKNDWDKMSVDERKKWLNDLGDQLAGSLKASYGAAGIDSPDDEINNYKTQLAERLSMKPASEVEAELLPFDRISLLGILAAFWLRKRGIFRSP